MRALSWREGFCHISSLWRRGSDNEYLGTGSRSCALFRPCRTMRVAACARRGPQKVLCHQCGTATRARYFFLLALRIHLILFLSFFHSSHSFTPHTPLHTLPQSHSLASIPHHGH